MNPILNPKDITDLSDPAQARKVVDAINRLWANGQSGVPSSKFKALEERVIELEKKMMFGGGDVVLTK